jgi:hypothetical protein
MSLASANHRKFIAYQKLFGAVSRGGVGASPTNAARLRSAGKMGWRA